MSESLTKVYHQLYIGDYNSAQDSSGLNKAGITHVIRCLVDANEEKCLDGIAYLNIEVQDLEQDNLLQHFNTACTFIQDALEGGQGVLVHCQAGVSRSAAVVIAYIMKMEQMSYEQALVYVQATRSCILPNNGFRDQCKLFAEMNYTVDKDHVIYRRFVNQSGTENIQLVKDPLLADTSTTQSTNTTEQKGLSIRCRKCRRPLLTNEHLIPHTPGTGQSAFSPHRRNQQYRSQMAAPPACSSHFIEPMEWIDGITDGSHEGKIQCPKCLAKLGQYNWSGAQCSCGAWITPAIALHRNRVDAIPLM
ncbi:dual specificity protein phosphatase 12 [Syncephalis fuscata]|nr:dual specificity protein phosphatase 12 [Syncephalis fuscata]